MRILGIFSASPLPLRRTLYADTHELWNWQWLFCNTNLHEVLIDDGSMSFNGIDTVLSDYIFLYLGYALWKKLERESSFKFSKGVMRASVFSQISQGG